MAVVGLYICDRCKRELTISTKDTEGYPESWQLIEINDHETEEYRRYDLCSTCRNKLEEFIKVGVEAQST